MSQARPHRAVRRRLPGVATAFLTTAALALTALIATPAQAAPVGEITQTITHDGKTLTVRLDPFAVRSPNFEVLVQQGDGTLVKQSVAAERAYLGTVDGDTGARASAIRRSDGALEGSIVFDRGEAWYFVNGTVNSVDGDWEPNYRWPTASNANLVVSTAPGQVGNTTYRWDVGYDLANDWFTHSSVGGSVAKALDAVEIEMVQMAGLYISNAELRPALGRVIIRSAVTKDPYASGGRLNTVTDEWSINQKSANVDVVVLRSTPNDGGGVAWISTAASGWTGASVQGAYTNVQAGRHEIGHNWGTFDYHTNSPEGPTVMSGNAFERFDGTELSAIIRHRDSVLKNLTSLGAFTMPMPPYAALDLVDSVDSGVPRQVRPVANDHDANGDSLTLASVEPTSRLGGKVSMYSDRITYTPPAVAATNTFDSVKYVVRDATGRTATGLISFRVSPAVDPGPATNWAAAAIQPTTTYTLTNRESGYRATARGEAPLADIVQRPNVSGNLALFSFASAGGGAYRMSNVNSGKCLQPTDGATTVGTTVAQVDCTDALSSKWRVVTHPKGGVGVLNVKSGLCLAPRGGSLASGTPLALANCGLALYTAWDASVPSVSQWPAAPVAQGTAYTLRHLGSGYDLGGDRSDDVILKTGGSGKTYRFTTSPAGHLYLLDSRNTTWNCVSGGGETSVYLYECLNGGDQQWKVLQHPAGGVALFNVKRNACLVPNGTAANGAAVRFEPCGASKPQRWSLLTN